VDDSARRTAVRRTVHLGWIRAGIRRPGEDEKSWGPWHILAHDGSQRQTFCGSKLKVFYTEGRDADDIPPTHEKRCRTCVRQHDLDKPLPWRRH